MSEHLSADDTGSLEKLALGLLLYPGDQRVNQPHLFLGKIPETFPLSIPVPDKSQVLGTLARSDANIEIVIQSALEPTSLMDFYREQLQAAGWTSEDPEMPPHMGGFIRAAFNPLNHRTFFLRSASINLNIVALSNTLSDIRLDINLNSEAQARHPRTKRQQRMMHHNRMRELIPALPPPPEAQQQNQGGGSNGMDEAHTTAKLRTTLDIGTLSKHYAEQLNIGGWQQTAQGADGPLAWHTWKFTDEDQEPWGGLFFILQTPQKQGEYFLYVRAEWTKPEDNEFTGWSNSIQILS